MPMRDQRVVAVHRGGLLTKEDHMVLMHYARMCALHVLELASLQDDELLVHALKVAERWELGNASTGEAIASSRLVHAYAKNQDDVLVGLAARAIGQAVATAHMADHCLGPSWYARKVVRLLGTSVEEEDAYQQRELEKLPSHLVSLVKFLQNQKHMFERTSMKEYNLKQ